MPHTKRSDVLDAVGRAMARAASVVHGEMGRGLSTLAGIAATAPFVGFFGTLIGIVYSFPGFGSEKSTMLAIVTGLLSESLVPTALGLLAALLAYFGLKFLQARLEQVDVEMEIMTLELVNLLGAGNSV